MRVVITGSAGFIGYHLTKHLLECGYEVFGIDNFSQDYNITIKKNRNKELLKYANYTLVNEDLLQPFDLNIDSADYFIHLATKDFLYEYVEDIDYSNYLEGTVLTTSKAFELAHRLSVKKFIFYSTTSIYGTTKKKTYTEKDIIPNPSSPQGASKLAAEQTVKYLSKLYYIPAIILRISTAYGTHMRPYTLIPHLINKVSHNEKIPLHISKSAKRDFIDVADVVNITEELLKRRLTFQVFNIASGESTKIEDVASFIATHANKNNDKLEFYEESRGFGDMIFRNVYIDISKAKKMLNFSPNTKLKTSLYDVTSWYLSNEKILKLSIKR